MAPASQRFRDMQEIRSDPSAAADGSLREARVGAPQSTPYCGVHLRISLQHSSEDGFVGTKLFGDVFISRTV